MKIRFILLCIVCFLFGCQNQKTQLKDYDEFIQKIDQQVDYQTTSSYYHTDLILTKQDQGYRYDFIVKDVSQPLKHVRIVCKDNSSLTLYYPSLGVYDQEDVTLDNQSNKENSIYKGVNLSGLVEKLPCQIKALIEFEDQNGILHQEYIQLEKDSETCD